MGFTNKNKALPIPESNDEEFEFYHVFEPTNVKAVVHSITNSLKKDKNINIEYLFLPFRKEQTNENLLRFLNAIFPLGNGKPINNVTKIDKIIEKTKGDILFQALKYIWCRLPGTSGIVGWRAYNLFKEKEAELRFPQRAFLEIMPKNLESPDHASLVYDFFDLIVTMSSNANKNKLSARKISRMCALWAFPCENSSIAGSSSSSSSSPSATSFYNGNDLDFSTGVSNNALPNNSFQEGLKEWIPASNAMFHLTMSFIKSFLPEAGDMSENFPKTLQHVLQDNEYPPEENSWITSSSTILQVPLISLQTTEFSRKPWDLIKRLNDLLCSHDPEIEAGFDNIPKQDYMVLKNLFKTSSSSNSKVVENISKKMSKQSKKLMKEMTTKHSTFQAGWASNRKCLPVSTMNPSKDYLKTGICEIDDYFIWTWMSSISNEQTSMKRKIFGRSLILEFEFDGFKKWVIFEECDSTIELLKNKNISNGQKSSSKRKIVSKKTNVASPAVQEVKKTKDRQITPVYEKFQKLNIKKNSNTAETSKKSIRDFSTSTIASTSTTSNIPEPKGDISSRNGKKDARSSPLKKEKNKGQAMQQEEKVRTAIPSTKPTSQKAAIPNGFSPTSNIHSSRAEPQRAAERETYKLPEVNVNESNFKIDLPAFDASHITIEDDSNNTQGSSFYSDNNNIHGSSQNQYTPGDSRQQVSRGPQVKGRNLTDSSLNNAVQDLTAELQTVEDSLQQIEPQSHNQYMGNSVGSAIQPLQIDNIAKAGNFTGESKGQTYHRATPNKKPLLAPPESQQHYDTYSQGHYSNQELPPQPHRAAQRSPVYANQPQFPPQANNQYPSYPKQHPQGQFASHSPAPTGYNAKNSQPQPRSSGSPAVPASSSSQPSRHVPSKSMQTYQPKPHVQPHMPPNSYPVELAPMQPPAVFPPPPQPQPSPPNMYLQQHSNNVTPPPLQQQQPRANKGVPFGGMPRTNSMQNLTNVQHHSRFNKHSVQPSTPDGYTPPSKMVNSASSHYLQQQQHPRSQQPQNYPPRMNTNMSSALPMPQQRHSMVGHSVSPMLGRQPQSGVQPMPQQYNAPVPQAQQPGYFAPPSAQQIPQQQMYYAPQQPMPQQPIPQQPYGQQSFIPQSGLLPQMPHNKLHSANLNKTAGRKNLHAQIKNGNFGI
ncbi:hypothetical protein ACO0RG_003328 [Hanseniaspora osmophila]